MITSEELDIVGAQLKLARVCMSLRDAVRPLSANNPQVQESLDRANAHIDEFLDIIGGMIKAAEKDA